MVITPLVPVTLFRALSGRFDRHRKIARWTWPLWMYVAVSGVVVYVMSVHLFPYDRRPHMPDEAGVAPVPVGMVAPDTAMRRELTAWTGLAVGALGIAGAVRVPAGDVARSRRRIRCFRGRSASSKRAWSST